MSEQVHDVAVIGGGVVGCAVLRQLAMGGLNCVMLEKGADILSGASKGNSALLHTGFDAPTGSLELSCMRDGYREYLAIRERLNLPLVETGAVVVAWNDDELAKLPAIVAQAHANGVPDVRSMTPAELYGREPHLAPGALAAVLVPGEHVIDAWSAPLAYVLQAIVHGAAVRRDAQVTGGKRAGDRWVLETSSGKIAARVVVNAAGLYGDRIESIAREAPFSIRPRKGQFAVFDKSAYALVRSIVLPVPTERTKVRAGVARRVRKSHCRAHGGGSRRAGIGNGGFLRARTAGAEGARAGSCACAAHGHCRLCGPVTRDAVQGISDRGVARSRLDHGGRDPLDGPHRRARHRLARRRPVRPVLRSDRWHPRAGLESGAQPETAIVKTSHLVLDPATGGPVVDQYGRCSDPTYFAAGNLLRPVEASWTAWREGRDVARAIAASLRGSLPQAARHVALETQGPVRYVCPQRVAFPAPVPAALPINIRVSRLCVVPCRPSLYQRARASAGFTSRPCTIIEANE